MTTSVHEHATHVKPARAGEAPAKRRAAARVAGTNAVAARFFADNADAIARACHAMATRFQSGGRLLVAGDGAQRSDVSHVVVEFVHPVVVGKRALPAIALPASEGGAAESALAALGRADDLLMIMCGGAPDDRARAMLSIAHARGLLTIALTGAVTTQTAPTDHAFAIPSGDACIVQETHEMLYHVLWELVHVFFEHRVVST